MRVVLVVLWIAVALALILPLLGRRRLASARRGRLGPVDELVKDPVCQTYIVRSRAVRGPDGEGAPYFCSAECARRYATGA